MSKQPNKSVSSSRPAGLMLLFNSINCTVNYPKEKKFESQCHKLIDEKLV